MTDTLDRIAAALERLAPPAPPAADPLAHPAYGWRGGGLVAVRGFAPLPLDLLHGIAAQKAALVATLRRHAEGLPAHDALLWGARGTGKSALAKAAVAEVRRTHDLALVEPGSVAVLPDVFARLAGVERRFVVFVDDLGVDAVAAARTLRSLLDGGAEARPANVRLVVTSNRRHLLARDHSPDTAMSARDAEDDQLALADRFGLSLGFHVVDQDGYLAIVRGYAARYALPFDAADALLWARQRGGRSGRVAWHYVVELAGREGVSL